MSQLRDEPGGRAVSASELTFQGAIWGVVRDTVELGASGTVRREYVRHPGAVGILALDESDRVLLVRQYRHPVRHYLWELPAGLLDEPKEHPLQAAQRELAEEADLRADSWATLIDWFSSPGGMDEAVRVYLARGIHPVPEADRHERQHEEAELTVSWFPLDDACDAVLAGRLHNPTTVVSVLAARAARDSGWRSLRPAEAPWPEHPADW